MPKNKILLAALGMVSLLAIAAIYPGSVEAGPGTISESGTGGTTVLVVGIALTVIGWVGRKTS